jgi:hypothetical protein
LCRPHTHLNNESHELGYIGRKFAIPHTNEKERA